MNDKNPLISIVSPVYKAERIIDELVSQLSIFLSGITENYEIVLVDDFSPDDSWRRICEIARSNEKVKALRLSRNFGQHFAINAGLTNAKGDWIIVMDCDLQDKPSEIPKLYAKALEGYDIVLAQRSNRKDNFFKKFFSKLFYSLFSYFTETKQDSSVANFGIYRKCVIESILTMGDKIPYFPTMVQWVGFNKYYLSIDHGLRFEGKSSYNFKSLIKLAFNNIISFSDKPLRLTVKLGLLISLLSLIVGLKYFIGYVLGKIEVEGFTSLIISIWFLSGLIIFVLGIVGLYIGRTFEVVKNRPLFIVAEGINFE